MFLMKKIFTLIVSLMLLGATSAWGECYLVNDATGGSGSSDIKSYELTEQGATLTFDVKTTLATTTNSKTLYVYEYDAGGNQVNQTTYTDIKTSVTSKTISLNANTRKVTFKAKNYNKNVTNVLISKTRSISLAEANSEVSPFDFGTIPANTTLDQEITVRYKNIGNSIVADVDGMFSVVEQVIDECDETSTRLTIRYAPTAVGSHTGTLTIAGSNGTSTTLYVKGVASAVADPTFTWHGEESYPVEAESIDLDELWTSNSPAAITYAIRFTPDEVGEAGATAPVLNANNLVSLGQAGTLHISATQAAATGFNAITTPLNKNIRIEKRTPVFSLNATEPYYFESVIENVLNLTEGDAELVSFTTSDATVAEVIDGALHIYDKEGTVTITATHAANYKWAELSHDYEMTPENAPLFIINSQAKYDELKCNNSGTCAYNNGIEVGDRVGGGFNWDDKYVDIHFNATPDKLSFTTTTTAGTATRVEFRVFESADGSNWDEIWSSTDKSNNVSNLQLQPSTRYLRFLWSGNFAGTFVNVTVTEQQIAPIEVTAGALNVANSTYYSMFCHAETVVLIDATAYTASFEGDALVLTECEDGIIPANTVVMVAGAEDHYSYLPYDGTVAPVDNNAFKIHHYSDAENHRDYVLAEKDGVVAFHRYIADDEIAEIDGKKVLVWESASAQTPAVINIVTEGETATALLPVYDDNKQYQNNRIYTIMGLPVSDMSAPGIYILNGQKYIVR